MSIPKHCNTDPDAALRAITDCKGTLVLDFDYNLYLGNSTEDYLRTLRPAWLAYVLISTTTFFVRVFGPFWGMSIHVWRDFLWAQITWLMFPWARLGWKRTARRLMAEKLNREIVAAVNTSSAQRIVIISLGYDHIQSTLVKLLPFKAELIASRVGWRAHNLRIKTKRKALDLMSEEEIRHAVFVTDSKDDRDLLELFGNSHCVPWTKTAPFPFAGVYVPFRYTAEGKYAVPDILWNQHFTEDLIVLMLAYAGSFADLLAIPLLFVSFFCVYEMGYYENNTLAVAHEENPTVAAGHAAFSSYGIYRQGMLWASVTGLLGCLLCEMKTGLAVAYWVAALLTLRGVFYWFNRLTPRNRVYLFPFLQILKMFSYAPVIGMNPAGILLLVAQVMRQTTNYMIYRNEGNTTIFKRQAHRLLIFVMGTTILLLSGHSLLILHDWQFYAGLLWCIYRVLREAYGPGLRPALILAKRLGAHQ